MSSSNRPVSRSWASSFRRESRSGRHHATHEHDFDSARLGPCRGRHRVADVSTVPRNEHHQAPQLEPVRPPAGHVVSHHRVDRTGIEDRDVRQRSGRQQVVDQRPRRTAQPRVHGDAEALLGGAGHVDAVGPPRQLTEHALGRAGARHLERRRQTQRELGEIRIEKRRADFEAVSHAHAIGFREDVVRQVLADIGCLQLAERRPLGQRVACREPLQRRSRRGGERRRRHQPARLLGQPGAVPAEMRDRRRQMKGAQEAARLVGRRHLSLARRQPPAPFAPALPRTGIGIRDVMALWTSVAG